MSDVLEKKLDELVARKPLSPNNQRKLWARVTIIKRILIGRGFITAAEWEAEESAMVRDIEAKMRDGVKRELGLDE